MVYPWSRRLKCSVCAPGSSKYCAIHSGGISTIGGGHNPGGFSTHVPVPDCKFLVKVPENIPMDIACMLPCSGLTTYSAVQKTQSHVETALKRFGVARLLIIGAGGLGLWAIQNARILYKEKNVKIVVADVNQGAIDIALKAGADEGVFWDPKDDSATLAAKTTHDGKDKIDAVMDLVGKGSTASTGLACLHRMGALIVVGMAGGELKMPLLQLIMNGFVCQGIVTGTLGDLRAFVDQVSQHKMNYPSLEYYALENVNDVIERLKTGKVKGRAILKF